MSNEDQILAVLNEILAMQREALANPRKAIAAQELAIVNVVIYRWLAKRLRRGGTVRDPYAGRR